MSYSLVCKICGRFVDIDDFDKESGCCDWCSAVGRKRDREELYGSDRLF